MSWFVILAGLTSVCRADAFQPEQFFGRYCFDCHANGAEEGGLDLQTLGVEMDTPLQVQRWTHIWDRVEGEEMPPADSEQPGEQERRAFLQMLTGRLETADRRLRETVQRRLNREEYQNTVADLLGVDLDLKRLLPEDQRAGGFDNNGEALALSAELMGLYLDAAEQAVDAALVKDERPETVTMTAESFKEVERYVPKQFGVVDGRVVVFTSNDTQYSKVSTRSKRLPRAGRYRFRFEVVAHRSDQPLVFSVVASDFAQVAAVSRNLGYFVARPEPRTIEIEATLGKGYAIQFFVLGLPGWIKDASSGEHPGVGFGPVEISGPLSDAWPPESHTRLVGDVSLEAGTLADAERVLRAFLPRAFRRPVTDAEVERYVGLVQGRLNAGRSFEQSLRAGLSAVLCSPNFLYLREDVRDGTSRLSDHELAARLSYFLWSSMPDAELLNAAAEGTLQRPQALEAQIERMLDDPRADRFVTNFVGQWLRLREIEATTPDRRLYPEFDELLQVSMVREGEGFFRTLLREDLDIVNFLDSDFAMLNRRLAEHYELADLPGLEALELRKVSLPPESLRGGVLTQAGVLKVTANGTNTSPVTRGVWVLENVLGQTTPPPPPNIAGVEPDIRGATTIREQLAKHRNVASCNSCHQHIDPPGFTLESFDPVGAYRERYLQFIVNEKFADKGWGRVVPTSPVDASGHTPDGTAFTDIRGFKEWLVSHEDQFARCLTEKLLTYALGRELGFSDRSAVEEILEQARGTGGERGLRSLVHAVVLSETFSTR